MRRKKWFKYVWVAGGVLLALVVWLASSLIYSNQLKSQKAQFQSVVKQKDDLLKQYEVKSRKGWVLQSDKKAGDTIMETDVKQLEVPDYFTPSNVMLDKNGVVGKTIKLDAQKATVLTDAMIYENGPLDGSTRQVETDYISLPLQMQAKDTVDIRIVFPNGEDYVVIPKKKIDTVSLPDQLMFFKAPEAEIQLLNSAIVDSYVNNAEIYAVRYVDPEMQAAPSTSYIPNTHVIDVMNTDISILDKAKYNLTTVLRKTLDDRMKNLPQDARTRVRASLPAGSGVTARKKAVGGGALTTQPGGTTTVKPGAVQPAPNGSAPSTPATGGNTPVNIDSNTPASGGQSSSKATPAPNKDPKTSGSVDKSTAPPDLLGGR